MVLIISIKNDQYESGVMSKIKQIRDRNNYLRGEIELPLQLSITVKDGDRKSPVP